MADTNRSPLDDMRDMPLPKRSDVETFTERADGVVMFFERYADGNTRCVWVMPETAYDALNALQEAKTDG